MLDSGKKDYKIMAVPKKDPFYNTYNDISELPEHISEEISHFFKVYKTLENKNTEIGGLYGKEVAQKVLKECILAYQKD